MRTKLLKKLRAEAHRAYCIKNKADLPKIEPQLIAERKWEGVYIIGLRNYTDKADMVEFKQCLAKIQENIVKQHIKKVGFGALYSTR